MVFQKSEQTYYFSWLWCYCSIQS